MPEAKAVKGRIRPASLGWVTWGTGVEVLTRRLCGGCQELKRRLREAGIPFRELDIDSVDGLAAWAYYGAPAVSPAVAIDGRLIDRDGDVDALFEEVVRAAGGPINAANERR